MVFIKITKPTAVVRPLGSSKESYCISDLDIKIDQWNSKEEKYVRFLTNFYNQVLALDEPSDDEEDFTWDRLIDYIRFKFRRAPIAGPNGLVFRPSSPDVGPSGLIFRPSSPAAGPSGLNDRTSSPLPSDSEDDGPTAPSALNGVDLHRHLYSKRRRDDEEESDDEEEENYRRRKQTRINIIESDSEAESEVIARPLVLSSSDDED